jgi:hypothetical protein
MIRLRHEGRIEFFVPGGRGTGGGHFYVGRPQRPGEPAALPRTPPRSQTEPVCDGRGLEPEPSSYNKQYVKSHRSKRKSTV